MKNKILSVVAGVLVGWIIVAIGDMIGHSLFPMPEDLDISDKEALSAHIESLPITAFLFMLLAWMVSSFCGGAVTGKLAKSNWQRLCLITGGILLAANIVNMFVIPQPLWFNLVTILIYLPLAYFGGKVVQS